MKIGIVCPYSFDYPGGVKQHTIDLAKSLIAKGHYVEIIAPSSPNVFVDDFVVKAGRTMSIPINGSVARIKFGTGANTRINDWLESGNFDLLHIHEPIFPSIGLLALWNTTTPVVATFHASFKVSQGVNKIMEKAFKKARKKITQSICVSLDAQKTASEAYGLDSTIIPNGVFVNDFANAKQDERFMQKDQNSPTILFLGRVNEERKGLNVLLEAMPFVQEKYPNARLLIAGTGKMSIKSLLLKQKVNNLERLGKVSETNKRALMKSASCYVAPQTMGESFGIVLIEAMSAGCPVIASKLSAFNAVSEQGKLARLFNTENHEQLAKNIIRTVSEQKETEQIVITAKESVQKYDWSVVTEQILEVYNKALALANTEPYKINSEKGLQKRKKPKNKKLTIKEKGNNVWTQ